MVRVSVATQLARSHCAAGALASYAVCSSQPAASGESRIGLGAGGGCRPSRGRVVDVARAPRKHRRRFARDRLSLPKSRTIASLGEGQRRFRRSDAGGPSSVDSVDRRTGRSRARRDRLQGGESRCVVVGVQSGCRFRKRAPQPRERRSLFVGHGWTAVHARLQRSRRFPTRVQALSSGLNRPPGPPVRLLGSIAATRCWAEPGPRFADTSPDCRSVPWCATR